MSDTARLTQLERAKVILTELVINPEIVKRLDELLGDAQNQPPLGASDGTIDEPGASDGTIDELCWYVLQEVYGSLEDLRHYLKEARHHFGIDAQGEG